MDRRQKTVSKHFEPDQELGGAFFEYDLPSNEWLEFEAEGFSYPVTGVIYRTATPIRGMPLGGIGTGFMHLGPDGLLDRGTAFNTFLPPGASAGYAVARKDIPAYEQPILGLAVGDDVWILALPSAGTEKGFEALTDKTALEGHPGPKANVAYAQDIHYWGHYPVVDMEYETTAPVRVGARIWTPFLPGDAETSNTPGIVIEVRVRNTSGLRQKGSIIVNFPGFGEFEAVLGFRGSQMGLRGSTEYPHYELKGALSGVFIHHSQEEYNNQIGYALGVIGEKPARIGQDLGFDPTSWSAAGRKLPEFEPCEPGTSMAVDFELEPGEARTLRFVLGWFAPFWQARHGYLPKRIAGTNPYTHRYYDRFKSEVDVAEYLAREHSGLLRRVLSWQEALYASQEIRGWLQDSLINIFHNVAQNSFWAVSRAPGHWAGDDGLFCMNETLPTCAQQACIPCDFIAQFPLLFFFPDLVRQGIRGYTARQRPNGEVPFIKGAGTEMDDPCYGTQYSTDCQVYVHLVARLWQRTGDREVLSEFYPAVKKAVRFLQGVDQDGDGLVDVWGGSWFYEGFPLKGASVFAGGLWLSTLRLAALMAGEMDDDAFAEKCGSWLERGSATLEDVLWDEKVGAYSLFHQPATGSRSDVILSDQLVGDWATHFHAVERVFPPERVRRVQDTVWRINVAGCETGARATMHPNRSPYQGGYIAAYGTLMPAMIELYCGDAERGQALARRMWYHITCRKGWAWDHPSHIQADGERMVGHDYYHNPMLWALPAAVLRQDLASFCAPGGIVDRVLQAALAGTAPTAAPPH
jgi:uncharacterized protein (DUF608 family)